MCNTGRRVFLFILFVYLSLLSSLPSEERLFRAMLVDIVLCALKIFVLMPDNFKNFLTQFEIVSLLALLRGFLIILKRDSVTPIFLHLSIYSSTHLTAHSF